MTNVQQSYGPRYNYSVSDGPNGGVTIWVSGDSSSNTLRFPRGFSGDAAVVKGNKPLIPALALAGRKVPAKRVKA